MPFDRRWKTTTQAAAGARVGEGARAKAGEEGVQEEVGVRGEEVAAREEEEEKRNPLMLSTRGGRR